MMQTSTFQSPAIGRISTAGLLFIIVGVLTAIIDCLALFLALDYLDIISAVILAVAIIVLGTAMNNLTTTSYNLTQDAKKTGATLIAYVITDILTAIFVLFVPILSIITGIIALILRILGFTYLNNTFRKLGQNMDSSMFPLFGWYGVIVVVALIVSAFTASYGLIITIGIIAIVGEILLLIGIGIKLRNNANIMLSIQIVPPMQPTYQPMTPPVQPIQPTQTTQTPTGTIRFCPSCGAKIEEDNVKFCANCGTTL